MVALTGALTLPFSFLPQLSGSQFLTLSAPTTTAADNSLVYFFIVSQIRKRLDIFM